MIKQHPLAHFFNNSMKNQPILIIVVVYNIFKKLDIGNYKLSHPTYKLLPHYLAKCKK